MRKYYKYYFEQLCIQNKLIAHVPDTDTAYYFLKDKYDLEDFDNAIKSVGHTPAFLLENYFVDGGDGSARNYFKLFNGRFSILDKAVSGDKASIDTVQERCEALADDFLAKMREQLMEGAPIVISDADRSKTVFFLYQNIKIDFIGPVSTNYYGVSVGFTWKMPANAQSNPDNWT